MQNQGGMMQLSILVGVFHIVLANLITAWRLRNSLCCLGPMGWVTMIFGGVLLGYKMFGGDPLQLEFPLEIVLMIAGAVIVLLFASERPVKGVGSVAWRLLDGVQRLTGVSQAFGDILSYLRLFALGLASAQLAMAFNSLAGDVLKVPGVGILFAIFIQGRKRRIHFIQWYFVFQSNIRRKIR